MKKILYTILAFGTFSCSATDNDLKIQEVKGVEIKINVGDSTMYIFSSESKEEFTPYLNVVSNSSAPKYKCGYSGELTYYYNSIPNPITHPEMSPDEIMEHLSNSISLEFNLSEDCNHIVYLNEAGELISKKLTTEGRAALLKVKNEFKRTPETIIISNTSNTEETPVEEEGIIRAGTPEKVAVDRTKMETFWREFKQLISFKDEAELTTMFSVDYNGILSGLYKNDEYRKYIAASSHTDVKETKELHNGNVVYEIMFVFPPEFPEEGQEESATTIYMQKNAAGNFEIFSVIEAG